MRLFSATAVVCASLLAAVSFVHAQSPEVLAKRQCRSVHIRQDGHPAQAAALYNEVKARTSVPGTYFCAMNFDDGYIGFQEQSNGRKVIIFSIWDPVSHGDNPNSVPEEERTKLLKLGENARAGRFGGEGTGGQSFVDYPWEVGENMRFLVCIKKNGAVQGNQRLLLQQQDQLLGPHFQVENPFLQERTFLLRRVCGGFHAQF